MDVAPKAVVGVRGETDLGQQRPGAGSREEVATVAGDGERGGGGQGERARSWHGRRWQRWQVTRNGAAEVKGSAREVGTGGTETVSDRGGGGAADLGQRERGELRVAHLRDGRVGGVGGAPGGELHETEVGVGPAEEGAPRRHHRGKEARVSVGQRGGVGVGNIGLSLIPGAVPYGARPRG